MSEVFLYTPEANINSTHLEALRKNGFIPVKVASMDAVKIMPVPVAISASHMDLILVAAMQAIAGTDSTAKSFGNNLARALLAPTKDGASHV